VEQAGETMQDIVTSVRKVTEIVGEIALASQQQSDGIGQVNVAISQMDQMTQQNAALVEEAAAASQALHEQAQTLEQVVGVFQVDANPLASKPDPYKAASRLAVAAQPSSPAPRSSDRKIALN